MNKCTKYEFHLTSECKVTDGCSCFYGNKVSIATKSFMDFDRPDEQLYQLWISYDFRMQSYLQLAYQLATCNVTSNSQLTTSNSHD